MGSELSMEPFNEWVPTVNLGALLTVFPTKRPGSVAQFLVQRGHFNSVLLETVHNSQWSRTVTFLRPNLKFSGSENHKTTIYPKK